MTLPAWMAVGPRVHVVFNFRLLSLITSWLSRKHRCYYLQHCLHGTGRDFHQVIVTMIRLVSGEFCQRIMHKALAFVIVSLSCKSEGVQKHLDAWIILHALGWKYPATTTKSVKVVDSVLQLKTFTYYYWYVLNSSDCDVKVKLKFGAVYFRQNCD